LFVLREARDGWTTASQSRYFEMLGQMQNYQGGQGMNDFIAKIRADVAARLSEAERVSLEAAFARQEKTVAADSTIEPRKFVRRWTVDELIDEISKISRPGDPQQGEAMFVAAACVHCHRAAGIGRLIGPDLTGVGRRFSQRDLLDSIVNPSKVIPEKYQSIQILTRDGKVYVGQTSLAGDYRSPVLRLATDASQPYKTIDIEKSNIETQSPAKISWMPAGLLDTLTAEEVHDLVAYLLSAG
jgi:putative heme-binding domain-containing protein